MVRCVKLPVCKHPHDCQCKTCTHCVNIDHVDLPTEPPFCDPCWGHGGALPMTYKDYLEGHVTPPESSSGESSESNLASRFPTHNDFFGPTIDDVFVKIYNFGRNHPPPLHDCVKPNCKCQVCHTTCAGKDLTGIGCEDESCPTKAGEHHMGPYSSYNRGRRGSDNSDMSFTSIGGGRVGVGVGVGRGVGPGKEGEQGKKKPKTCHDKSCGKGKRTATELEDEKKKLGDDECDETTCGIDEGDNKGEAPWGIRDAFGVGIDETLLALLSQFGAWFKKRKKKKGSAATKQNAEAVCTCTEPRPYEPLDFGPSLPIKFEKGPLDVVHWLHEEFLSLCQDMEDAAKMDTPDTDGPLAPKNLRKRSANLDAISELLTEKRGLEQGGDPAQVDHKRSRAPSHYAEADISSMGVTPRVTETVGPGGQRKSTVNWDDAHAEQMLTRQSVSRQSMMGPRKSVVLRPRGTPSEHHQTWNPPAHDFGYEEPMFDDNYDSHSYGAGARRMSPPDNDRPRSILHRDDSRPSNKHIKMFGDRTDDFDDHGSHYRRTTPGGGIHFKGADSAGRGGRGGRRRSSLKYKKTPSDGDAALLGRRRSSSSDEGTVCRRRRTRSRPRRCSPCPTREVPGDDDCEVRTVSRCKMKKHQSPRRPTSIVEITRRTTESYKPNRRRGLFSRFGKSKPIPIDVEVESTQTIWHSSNFDTDSCSADENRAEKPYVEMALKGEPRGGGGPCGVRTSRSFKEEDIRRARVRKSQRRGRPRHEWDREWSIDADALQRNVNTQFPSSQTVRVTANCNEEVTYYTPEGCKRTDKIKTLSSPRVMSVRDGVPVVTGSNTVQVNIKKPIEYDENGVTAPTHRLVVTHGDDDDNRCSSSKAGSRKTTNKNQHDFDITYTEPPRKRKVVVIKREVSDSDSDDDDDDDDADDEEDSKSRKRKRKKRKKRKDDDDDDEEGDDENDDEKKSKNGRRGSLKKEDDGEDDKKKTKKNSKKKNNGDDEEEEEGRKGKSKKRAGGVENGGKYLKGKGKGVGGRGKKYEVEDEDGRKKRRSKGGKHICKCDDEDDDQVYRVVRAVKKGKRTKILPVITKIECLDGTKRRAILEWDDECANIGGGGGGPTKQQQGPKKCIREVLWAVTKITVFQDGTRAYEVKKPTRKTPTGRIPTVTEMLFMVQAHNNGSNSATPGGVLVYDKERIAAVNNCRGANGQAKPCCTDGMTKAFTKTDVDRYRIYKNR